MSRYTGGVIHRRLIGSKSLNGVNGRNKDFHRQGIPFVEGDVINFIVVRPPETQHQLTGVEPLIGKTYNVSLHVSSGIR
jgi:hypothetical protein